MKTDLIRVDNKWNNNLASKYREINRVTDPLTLRINAYRVLLTTGKGCLCCFYSTYFAFNAKNL